MQIHLKQLEIESAIKMYIAKQGISLTDKIVAIEFTAGRKESGLSAEMSIEDIPAEKRASSNQTVNVNVVSNGAPTEVVKDEIKPVIDATEAPAEPVKPAVSLFK